MSREVMIDSGQTDMRTAREKESFVAIWRQANVPEIEQVTDSKEGESVALEQTCLTIIQAMAGINSGRE
jgi:riboflavin synthase alpha subunit